MTVKHCVSFRLRSGDTCTPTLEGLVNVDSFLGTGLEVWDVALGLAKGHGTLVGNLASY
jgi:hypothetical protein